MQAIIKSYLKQSPQCCQVIGYDLNVVSILGTGLLIHATADTDNDCDSVRIACEHCSVSARDGVRFIL